MGTAIPIWAQGNSKPARVILIRGKSELLSGMDIVRKLDIAVRFGVDQFKVGQSEWGMVTFRGMHRWVFPLVPTASAYSKLNEYFGKLQIRKLRYCKRKGISAKICQYESFTGNKQRLQSKMGSSKAIIPDMTGAIQNSLLRSANTISGCSGAENDMWDLSEIEKLYNSEEDFEELDRKAILGIS